MTSAIGPTVLQLSLELSWSIGAKVARLASRGDAASSPRQDWEAIEVKVNGRAALCRGRKISGRTPTAYRDAQEQMASLPSLSGALVRHTANGKRVECGTLSWATGIEIASGSDDWYVFNDVKVSENDPNGASYEGQFATSLGVANAKDADDIGKWGRRRWDIESSFHIEKNGGYELEHNFCNKARVRRNIYLLMQIAHNLWQLFNRGCLLPLQKIRRKRNMTQKKWVEILL